MVDYYLLCYLYIGNTKQTFKKIMNGHFYDLLRLLKNEKKNVLFAAHTKQHFEVTTSHTDLHKYMAFKVVKQVNPIGAMQIFTKPNCNLCTEERLTALKKPRDKHVMFMNKNLEMYGAFRHKTTFRIFLLSTDDSI